MFFDGIIIGGAALALLGVTDRQTRDCDVLHPEIPAQVKRASISFARERRLEGDVLDEDWFNNGPVTLRSDLPRGWESRAQSIFKGEAKVLRTLGRRDLLRAKLFSLCDRGIDLQDCVALAPSAEEIGELMDWLTARDAHSEWPAHVNATMRDLTERLGHGV